MKIFNKLLFMLLAVGMFSSCIKEDMDDENLQKPKACSLRYCQAAHPPLAAAA